MAKKSLSLWGFLSLCSVLSIKQPFLTLPLVYSHQKGPVQMLTLFYPLFLPHCSFWDSFTTLSQWQEQEPPTGHHPEPTKL